MTSKEPVDTNTSPSIDAKNEYGPPVDFSFKCLTSFVDVEDEDPRKTTPMVKKNESGKIKATSVKFNNNTFTDLNGLGECLEHIIEEPSEISSLDFSFNDIIKINQDIIKFPNIKFLYFHGNSVSSLAEVDKLTALSNLQNLTLHGNPVEEIKGYKQYIVSKLPRLKNLDFTVITKADRKDAETWFKMYGKRKREKKKKDED